MASVRKRFRRLVGERWWRALRRSFGWARKSYLVVVLIGIVVGLQVAPVVADLATDPARGTVAVIPLEGGIDGGNAASVERRLRRARNDPSIDAVVLAVNSPGGGAAAGESIYMEVTKTSKQMPVVTSVNALAASAAYYSAAPSDAIYVKPASLIGSVGTVFIAPSEIDPVDPLIITGPNKLTGADRRDWYYKTESIQNAFVEAVYQHRGDKLEMSRERLAYAELYTGPEAVENGVADRIGSLDDAIKRAAKMAGLQNYRVKVLGYQGTVTFITRTTYIASTVEDKRLVSPREFIGHPGEAAVPTFLMLPASVVRTAAANTTEVRATNGTATA